MGTNAKKQAARNHILRRQEFKCAGCPATLTYETANLYHKRSRWDLDRRAPSHGKHVYEVMCRPCCDKLSAAKQARQPIELLHWKSQQHNSEVYYVVEGPTADPVGSGKQP